MPDYTVHPAAVVSLTGTTAKTVAAVITPATRRIRIKRVTLTGLSATSSHVPGTMEIVQFDTDGTGTAVTPVALDASETASLCTAKVNYTVEPSGGVVIRSVTGVSPQGVTFEKSFGPGEEVVVPVSKVIGVRVTFPDNQTVWPEIEYAE